MWAPNAARDAWPEKEGPGLTENAISTFLCVLVVRICKLRCFCKVSSGILFRMLTVFLYSKKLSYLLSLYAHSTPFDVRGQLLGVSFQLLPCGSKGSNLRVIGFGSEFLCPLTQLSSRAFNTRFDLQISKRLNFCCCYSTLFS